MKEPNISLFIALMAFLLALFAYFHSHSVIKEGHGWSVGHKHGQGAIPGVRSGGKIGPNVTVGSNTKIGSNAQIGSNAKMGADATIGPRMKAGPKGKLGPNANIGPNAKIESPVFIGPWKITSSGKKLVFQKGPAKFTMGIDRIFRCRGAKFKGPLESWTAKIGKPGEPQWHIRKDKIGIPKRADISLDEDKWVRLLEFATKKWAGQGGQDAKGGWAGFNIWSHVKNKGHCYCPMGLQELKQENNGNKTVAIFGTAKNNPKTGGAGTPASWAPGLADITPSM